MTAKEIIEKLKSAADDETLKKMAKTGVNTANALGVSMVDIRAVAAETGKNHDLAKELWGTGIHEAKVLATIIAEPDKADEKLLDKWVDKIASWDLCDQFCGNLVCKTEFAKGKILEWCTQDEQYIKRAGFSTMAYYVLNTEELREKDVDGFFGLILNECWDKRNYVRKAVSWALRNIGKTNLHYNRKAVRIAKQMKAEDLKPAQETAAEAIKELQKSDLLKKLKEKEN